MVPGVRAGFINSPVPGKGGRRAGRQGAGQGQAGPPLWAVVPSQAENFSGGCVS